MFKSSNHQIIKSSILILASCSDGPETGTETITKALVFNKFNIEQPRGHFAYIDEVVADVDEQQEVFSGFASRASGLVEAQTCIALNDVEFGSGLMTSSTRFTTALHVVLNDSKLSSTAELKIPTRWQ